MIDGHEKRNRQLAFELQNSHVCEKRSKEIFFRTVLKISILQGFVWKTVQACDFWRPLQSLLLRYTAENSQVT